MAWIDDVIMYGSRYGVLFIPFLVVLPAVALLLVVLRRRGLPWWMTVPLVAALSSLGALVLSGIFLVATAVWIASAGAPALPPRLGISPSAVVLEVGGSSTASIRLPET